MAQWSGRLGFHPRLLRRISQLFPNRQPLHGFGSKRSFRRWLVSDSKNQPYSGLYHLVWLWLLVDGLGGAGILVAVVPTRLDWRRPGFRPHRVNPDFDRFDLAPDAFNQEARHLRIIVKDKAFNSV